MFKAFFISPSGFLIPSFTGTISTFLPSNLAISTFLSAATIIPLAFFISSSVSIFFTPVEPFVSTFIFTPISFAFLIKASAAMYVCAIPVGHAVTARTSYPSFSSASVFSSLFCPKISRTSFGSVTFKSFSLTSSSKSIVVSFDKTSM